MKKLNLILPFALVFLAIIFPPSVSWAETTLPNDLDKAKALYYKNITSSYEHYNQIVTAAPENELARMDLIRILREMGKYKEAIAI